MPLRSTILPYGADFPQNLSDYCSQINEAIRQKKHHDQRRSLFMNFLRQAFNVDPVEVELEEKVKVANVQGYIDALYKWIIFEFKTDIERERPAAEVELKKYFLSHKNPEEIIAILTDGVKFESFQFEKQQLKQISVFTIDEKDPLYSFRYFDSLLFVSKKVTPKSIDITTKFGLESAIFNKSRIAMGVLFDTVKNQPSVKIKFAEWNFLLSNVYGERIGDQDLFIRHTYLALLSRLMVSNALFPARKRNKENYRGIMTGAFFRKNNLPNVAEPDFFSWALETSVENDFLGFIAKLEIYLDQFRFDNVGEDLLKEIYQELVDPESRHSLGEYYTPDWIADLALESIGYKGGTILDPACGSGTFLLAVIRRLRKNGLSGKKLIDQVLDNIKGIDVHPLAVIMSKANILLGLAAELKKSPREVYLPIYMADSLLVFRSDETESIEVQVSDLEFFHIPFQTASRDINLDQIIDRLTETAQRSFSDNTTIMKALKGLERTVFKEFEGKELWLWQQNFKLLCKLVKQGRDTVWGFILKNAYRPAFIRNQKVDYVVGNPPWLAYRYIKDKAYKARVKDMTLLNGLLDRSDVKLFTQLDTSTLFFVYSETSFLKKGGVIAFVLPKTTVLPAKQHSNFQDRGVSEIHDFSEVSPLFNVRSVLLIRGEKHSTHNIPLYEYKGKFPLKNLVWASAKPALTITKRSFDFLSSEVRGKHYYRLFQQGATLVPRCFWFVQCDKDAGKNPRAPFLETGDAALEEAKEQWRMKLNGQIENRFLFESILAKGIIPFGICRIEPVFLPIQKFKNSIAMADSNRLLELGYQGAATWLQKAESLWEKDRQSADRSLIEWINYNQKLIKQNISAPLVVLYNTSGTNVAAALYIRDEAQVRELPTKGFVAESVTYYYYPVSQHEGDYLVAFLNSSVVNDAIKEYQPQGLYGERHIHRRPFEVCAIPKFDSKNPAHMALSDLGKECRDDIKPFIASLHGKIGPVRTSVRHVLENKIRKIDTLVRRILESEGQSLPKPKPKKLRNNNHDIFE